jgi:uncharacterized phage-associated protein
MRKEMNTMTMRNFADHVISVSQSLGYGITNLQLQKVMYFTLGDYLRDNGIDNLALETYTEPFEAWTYGPVVRSEYFRFKSFGRFSIREKGLYNEQYNVFDEHIRKYINKSVNDLVEESHKHGTWYNNRQLILQQERVEYRLEDLVNDFAS